MNWFELQVKKLHENERDSFEKEQLEKLEADCKWVKENGYDNLHDWDSDDNLAFMKMASIIFVVIVGLIMWALIA